MSYRDILVYLPLPYSPDLVEYSVKLAKEFGAHLTGISSLRVTAMLRDSEQNPFIRIQESGDVAEAIRSEEQQAAVAERHFESASKREGIPHRWEVGEGDPGNLLLYACRLQDLIVLGQSSETSELLHGPVVQVVLSGYAALVLPSGTPQVPANHVVIAWNGSAQVADAVRQALPFLTRARRVSLLLGRSHEIHPGSRQLPSPDIEDYLRRHGIDPELVDFDVPDTDAGAEILSFAEETKADLIVMGAFGRSRFKEWVLGGATRFMLEHMTVPVVMAH